MQNLHHFTQMKKLKTIQPTILLLSIFITLTSSINTLSGSICPDNHYSTSGSYTADTSLTFNITSTVSNPLSYIVSLNREQDNSLYKLAISLQKFRFEIGSDNRIVYQIKIGGKNQSAFQVQFYSIHRKLISTMAFRYLIVSSNWSNWIHFQYITVNVYSNTTSASWYPFYDRNHNVLSVADMTGNVNAWPALTGLDIVSINPTNWFIIYAYANRVAPSQVQVQVSSSNNFFCNKISVLAINYNNNTLGVGLIRGLATIDRYIVFGGFPDYASSIDITLLNSFFYGNFYIDLLNQTFVDYSHSNVGNSFTLNTNNFKIMFAYLMITTFTADNCCQKMPYHLLGFNLCFDICPATFFSDPTNMRCSPCPISCVQCSSFDFCSVCRIGTPVNGRCTDSIGCIAINYDPLTNMTTCIQTMIGCLTIKNTLNSSICIMCDINNKFNKNGNNCTCHQGYQLQPFQNKCTEKCGDGTLLQLQCDDGNTFNYDGCSSNCKIQIGYICVNGSSNSSSVCYYVNRKRIVKFISADRIQGKNQGIFIFQFQPQLIHQSNDLMIKNIIFETSPKSAIQSWSLKSSTITIVVNYQENLEGNTARLAIQLNQLYFTQMYINQTFFMFSNGTMLIVSQKQSQISIIRTILSWISFVILCLFVIGSITHKMIGVQILNSCQTVLFLHTIAGNQTPPFSIFRYFSYLNANYSYLFNNGSNFYSHSVDFGYNITNLIDSQIIVAIILVFAIIVLILLWICQTSKKLQNKCSCKIVQKLSYFVYNRIMFPFTIGFYFLNRSGTFLSTTLNLQLNNPQMMSCLQLFLQCSTSVVFMFEVKAMLVDKLGMKQQMMGIKQCKSCYLPAYLLFVLIVFNLAAIENEGLINLSMPILLIISFAFIIWIIKTKPYTFAIHNVGLVFNLSIIVIFTAWSLLRNKIAILLSEQNQISIIFGIMLLVVVSCILTMARIIVEIKVKLCKQKHIKLQENNQFEEYSLENKIFENVKYKQKAEIYYKNKGRHIFIQSQNIKLYKQRLLGQAGSLLKLKNNISIPQTLRQQSGRNRKQNLNQLKQKFKKNLQIYRKQYSIKDRNMTIY